MSKGLGRTGMSAPCGTTTARLASCLSRIALSVSFGDHLTVSQQDLEQNLQGPNKSQHGGFRCVLHDIIFLAVMVPITMLGANLLHGSLRDQALREAQTQREQTDQRAKAIQKQLINDKLAEINDATGLKRQQLEKELEDLKRGSPQEGNSNPFQVPKEALARLENLSVEMSTRMLWQKWMGL